MVDFAFKERDDLLQVSLADQVCYKFEDLLVDFKRNYGLVLYDVKDICGVVFEYLCVHPAEGQNLIKNDDLHIIVVVIIHQVQIALNGDFNSTWGCSKLSDGVCTFK